MEKICLDWGAYELEQYSEIDLLTRQESLVNDTKRYLIINVMYNIYDNDI